MSSFIWDAHKDLINLWKYGVDFATASRALQDPGRKIYEDDKHGRGEERYFCVGKVGGEILTVRFVYRHGKIRIFGAGHWRKGKRYYEKENA